MPSGLILEFIWGQDSHQIISKKANDLVCRPLMFVDPWWKGRPAQALHSFPCILLPKVLQGHIFCYPVGPTRMLIDELSVDRDSLVASGTCAGFVSPWLSSSAGWKIALLGHHLLMDLHKHGCGRFLSRWILVVSSAKSNRQGASVDEILWFYNLASQFKWQITRIFAD